MNTIPPEIVDEIIEWLDPLSLRRIGVTCRQHHARMVSCTNSAQYGVILVTLAYDFLQAWMVRPATTVRTAARGLLEHLSCRTDHRPFASWKPPRLIRALYPIAIQCTEAWPWAKFALEWCALNDRRIFSRGAHTAPRLEILALLHEDALERLLRMSDTWAPCMATHAAIANTAYSATSPTTARILTEIRNMIMRAPGNLDEAIAGAALAAVLAARWQQFMNGPHYLGGTRPITKFGDMIKVASGDWKKNRWFELTGLDDSGQRNVSRLIDGYFRLQRQPVPIYTTRLTIAQIIEGVFAPLVPIHGSLDRSH